MEISKSVSNELSNLNNNSIASKQNNFLQSTTWKVIDKGLDIGIRSLLPNIIEDQVIEIKNAIINNGFKSGVKQAVNSAIDLGKSTAGIFTGKFESVSQARNVIKDGGIIDTISDTLNLAINKAVEKNAISSDTGKVIIRGKNAILNTIETNIENNYTYQLNSIEKLNKYTEESIDTQVLRNIFNNYNVLGKIKLRDYYDFIINQRKSGIKRINDEITIIEERLEQSNIRIKQIKNRI